MSEPSATILPIATVSGISAGAILAGLDYWTVVSAFGGALLFSFIAKDTQVVTRIMILIGTWIFGYIAAAEVVKRGFLGFTDTRLPAFVCAFFCVVVFKTLIVVFDES